MIVEPRKKTVYFGIHIEGRKPKRRFWRNLVFESDLLAEFYYDQECLALLEQDLPEKFRVDYVEDWEVDGRNMTQESLRVFQLPKAVVAVATDLFEHSMMSLKMVLQEESPPHYFYSSSFVMTGSPEKLDMDIGKSEDIQVFGVRLRPSCFAPNRMTHLSFRDLNIPGLWYFTIGYRRDRETLPIFMDELDPCALCPNKKD